MAERVLMEKGAESMFVPGQLVQGYLAMGWKEIRREVIPDAPEITRGQEVVQPQVKAEMPAPKAQAKAVKAAPESKVKAKGKTASRK